MGIGRGTEKNVYEVDPFEILKEAGGWYQCAKDEQGERLSPLVGYTARDELGRQFVGDEYVNFSKVEENPNLVYLLASLLAEKIPSSIQFDTICPVPEGGKMIGLMFALNYHDNRRYIYPDKEVKPPKKQGERGVSVFTFNKYKIKAGDSVILVEDVVNNFTSTTKLYNIIAESGGRVVVVASFFNRSDFFDNWFSTCVGAFIEEYLIDEDPIPVISLIRKKIKQYRQDDPFVLDDVKRGNVVWDPKNNWEKLIP